MQNVVRVFSTLALKGAVRSLAGRYEAASGARIDAEFAPTLGLLDRLRAGGKRMAEANRNRGRRATAGRGCVVTPLPPGEVGPQARVRGGMTVDSDPPSPGDFDLPLRSVPSSSIKIPVSNSGGVPRTNRGPPASS